MTITITVNTDNINNLDLSPVENEVEKISQAGEIAKYEQQINFKIEYEMDETDPREISEVPEVRLWFVRLDARYPWLPFLLDWKSGELYRYAAMLVPHQFHRTEGIQYNPEALEIFVMKKIFVFSDWLQGQNISSKSKLQSMAQTLGYELEDSFFEMIK
ncbi:CRR6 family NdhI maturation factor [Oscillatoria salina]|uniref:CRR6 family NdhI maturation factor n=1 Tax=Oscillatoria salina TaxID=331517 RepID=UPI0013BB0A6F|nr:CRR6 family NdhI maturation factor [Oscillatoria salina]MBZ8179232.1 CRR6 family NdhI maturation factor [Oscillatoria salina IIICB1]NET89563.1 CRR6 family NdhI maturation factor [Kamptonema sp. SIO1D9]